MSTTATVVDQNTKPESKTYGVYVVEEKVSTKNAAGEEIVNTKNVYKATSNEKVLAKAKEDKTFLFEQSFSYDKANTIAGITELGIEEDELVLIFNRGLDGKFVSKVLALLTEEDSEGNPAFQPIAGNFDARAMIAEATERRKMSDTEKALKTLKNLPEDVILQYLAVLKAQKSPESVG